MSNNHIWEVLAGLAFFIFIPILNIYVTKHSLKNQGDASSTELENTKKITNKFKSKPDFLKTKLYSTANYDVFYKTVGLAVTIGISFAYYAYNSFSLNNFGWGVFVIIAIILFSIYNLAGSVSVKSNLNSKHILMDDLKPYGNAEIIFSKLNDSFNVDFVFLSEHIAVSKEWIVYWDSSNIRAIFRADIVNVHNQVTIRKLLNSHKTFIKTKHSSYTINVRGQAVMRFFGYFNKEV